MIYKTTLFMISSKKKRPSPVNVWEQEEEERERKAAVPATSGSHHV